MSEWSWRFWRIGWLREQCVTKMHIGMGPETLVVWWVFFGRFCIKTRTVNHGGKFWEAAKRIQERKLFELLRGKP